MEGWLCAVRSFLAFDFDGHEQSIEPMKSNDTTRAFLACLIFVMTT
jgi:hypothetical protein